MNKRHDRIGAVWSLSGVIIQTVGIILLGREPWAAGLGLWSLGTALLTVGMIHAARAKNRSTAWAFLSILHLPGLTAVILLTDCDKKPPQTRETA